MVSSPLDAAKRPSTSPSRPGSQPANQIAPSLREQVERARRPEDHATPTDGPSVEDHSKKACRRSSSSEDRTSPTLPTGPATVRVLEAARLAGRCPSHVVPLLQSPIDPRQGAALEA